MARPSGLARTRTLLGAALAVVAPVNVRISMVKAAARMRVQPVAPPRR